MAYTKTVWVTGDIIDAVDLNNLESQYDQILSDFIDQAVKTTSSPTFAGATINGNIIISGTVDGVDVGSFKSDFDLHNHALANLTEKSYANLTDKPDLSALHSHTNKATLDTYTQSETDLADAVTKKHSHANLTALGNVSGTNTGDETQATIKTKLGVATSLVDGYLSATDWATFNAKQGALSGDVSGHYHTTDRNRANHSGTQSASTITGLASVATSGSYNDLSNKPTIPDITGKADKVASAVSGNIATLDVNGNLVDSGYDPTDFSASGHDHSGVYEPVFSKNTAFNKNFGSAVGDVCQGNDARLSDARTPVAHNHAGSEIASGTVAIERLPTGTGATNVALGNHTHSSFGALEVTGNLNISTSGVLNIAGTTVIDASRNLTNIGTVGCGAITTTGNLTMSNARLVIDKDLGIVGDGLNTGARNYIYGVTATNPDYGMSYYEGSPDYIAFHPNGTPATPDCTINGSGLVTATKFHASSNGASDNYRVGDDAFIGDCNTANMISICGYTSGAPNANGGIVFGTGKDTNLYRSGANILKTDDEFQASSLVIPGTIASTLTNDTNTGALRVTAGSNGYASFGPLNSGACHIYTDRASIVFNKTIQTTSGDLGTTSYNFGNLYMNGALFMDNTSIIDTNKNMANIGTIGCGAITSTGKLTINSGEHVNDMFTLNNTSASASDTNTLLLNRTNQTGTNLKLGVYDYKNGKYALINTNGYLVANTQVIDSSRNLTNIGTVGCGAITSTGAVQGTSLVASTGGCNIPTGQTYNINGVAHTHAYVARSGTTTDNTIPRWNGASADSIQGSGITIADTTNDVSGMGTLGCGDITSSGIISSSNEIVNAIRTSSANIASASATTIICNTEISDTGSDYNNTTGAWVAPRAGVYLFVAQLTYGSLAAGKYMQIYLEDSTPTQLVYATHRNTGASAQASDTITITTMLECASGRTIYFKAYTDNASTVPITYGSSPTQYTFFQAYYLG